MRSSSTYDYQRITGDQRRERERERRKAVKIVKGTSEGNLKPGKIETTNA
jgi:hypothetical protein